MLRILPPSASDRPATLLGAPVPITPEAFRALPFEERLAVVRSVDSRQKQALLLEVGDAERLVRALTPQEVYLLAREVGNEDLPELLALASSEQLETLLDFDGWRGDQLDADVALRWLTQLLESGEEKLLQTIREIDFALLVLVVAKQLHIISGPEDTEDEDARYEAQRHGGGYQLEYRDPEQAPLLAGFLDTLLRHDHDFFLHLMEAIRWENGAELEESVYGWRCDRLLDLGFPDPRAAAQVYAWLDPTRFASLAERKRPALHERDDATVAYALLAAGKPGGVLAEILANGISEELATELTMLINKVLTASQVDVGDAEQVRLATQRVYANLNLALEELCPDDPQQGAQLLEERYLEELFRFGFSLTLQLQQRARQVAASAIAPFLDGPFRALLTALERPQPAFYEGIDRPDRAGERLFANQLDLRRADAWLSGVEAQQRLFTGLLPFSLPTATSFDLAGCQPPLLAELTLSDLFLTALANRLLGRELQPLPVAAAELPALHARIRVDGQLAPELRRETVTGLETLCPGSGVFAEWCLDLWAEGLCALAPSELDPRYIDGLIVRL